MDFHKYPSITNSFKGDIVDYIKINHNEELIGVSWHIYEKIHGANFSLWYDGKEFKGAKRSAFTDGKNFFNARTIIEKYKPNIEQLYNLVKKPVVVYGELFGGRYDGQSTSNTKMVQKEVQYCPHVDFAAFDIAVINEDATILFLPEAEFHDLIFASQFFMAPYLGECKILDEALAFDNNFITKVPDMFNLPSLEKNVAEGVVIKPSKSLFMTTGSRIIFKKKNELFKESESVEVESSMSDAFMSFFKELRSHLTMNRFLNVYSKVGPDQGGNIYFNEFLADALNECSKIEYNTYTDTQKKLLNKLVAHTAWPIIKNVAYKKEVA